MRDNILMRMQNGDLDEDQLLSELVCQFDGSPSAQKSSLMFCGDSWDMSGWEFSPEFLERWSSLFDGCKEIFDIAPQWEMRRDAMTVEDIRD